MILSLILSVIGNSIQHYTRHSFAGLFFHEFSDGNERLWLQTLKSNFMKIYSKAVYKNRDPFTI